MKPVPKLDRDELCVPTVSASTDWFPKWDDCKHRYNSGDPYEKLAAKWFYRGLEVSDHDRLHPRNDVSASEALLVISTCLRSWSLKHEHKLAGASALFEEWFSLDKDVKQ